MESREEKTEEKREEICNGQAGPTGIKSVEGG